MAKKSFSLIEIIFSITLIALISSQILHKNTFSNLQLAANKIIIHLKLTRYTAMLDNKYKTNDSLWFRERWTMKFQNCSKKVGGIYYVIYSDKNHGGGINKTETLKDLLTDKYLYSNYDCKASANESKYILLTKEYGVTNIDISCNSTSTNGQITFDHNGVAYSRISTKSDEKDKYKIKSRCYIKLFDIDNNSQTIVIEGNTGYIHKL